MTTTKRTLFIILGLLFIFSSVSYAEFIVRKMSMRHNGDMLTLEAMDILEGEFLMNMGCRTDTGAVDIVFCIDSTGSMGTELADVRATIGDFASAMEDAGFDYAFGGVTFGDGTNVWDFDPSTPDINDLTSDLSEFETTLAGVGASGGNDGPETSMDAIYDAAMLYNWRPYAIHVIIQFTDITFCSTDYESGPGTCCCDRETDVSIADVFDAVLTSGAIVYNIYSSRVSGFPAEIFDSMSTATGGASYDLGIGFGPIFENVITHLGEYASIYLELNYEGDESVDSLMATLLPRACISPISDPERTIRNIDPGDRFIIGWPIDIDSLCGGGDRCFNIAINASDSYSDTIFGCTTTEDCHCIGPIGNILMPTPLDVVTACPDQAILLEATGMIETGLLDESTLEFRLDETTYRVTDPELSYAHPFISFNPIEPWEDGDTIYYCLAAVADINGCPMDEPICSEFIVDIQEPLVGSVYPPEDSAFYTDDFMVTLDISDNIAGTDTDSSYITINGEIYELSSDLVTYDGDSASGTITIEGSIIEDFGFEALDTAEICFHGFDMVPSEEFCGPNAGEQCFAWPIMILTQTVHFEEEHGISGTSIDIPLYIDSIPVPQIDSITLEVQFNPEVLRPESIVHAGTKTAGWANDMDVDPATGIISLTLTGDRIESGPEGILCYIRAEILETTNGGDFSNLSVRSCTFNRGFPMSEFYDGFFIVDWNIETWIMQIIINKLERPIEDLNLAIGTSEATTDNYDPGSDLLILPTTPSYVNAWLQLNDDEYPHFTKLRRDMRGIEIPVRWVIHTDEPITHYECYAKWDPSRLPEGRFFMNGTVDMKTDTIYYFTVNDSLVIEWTMPELESSVIEMCPGWNMISLPVIPPSWNPGEVFPFTPVDVFEYNARERRYETTERFEPGEGYWLYSMSDTTAQYAGVPLEEYRYELYPGWNLVGAISRPVDVADISTSPEGILLPTIYSYDVCGTGAYITATELLPGYGYWIMSTERGYLTVPGVATAKAFSKTIEPDWTGTIIIDEEPLIFGFSKKSEDNIDRMDIVLPPNSPSNIDEYNAFFNREDMKLRQDITPSMEWIITVPEDGTLEFDIPAEAGILKLQGDDIDIIVLDEDKIGPLPAGIYRVYAEGIPEEFELLGAYPNPFNAALEIAFISETDVKTTIEVFDIVGKKVSTLVDNEDLKPGRNTVRWDAGNAPSGIYFYRITSGDEVITKTISLVK